MYLTHCTLTGADDNTDLVQLAEISTEFPFVEWAFLYSPLRCGTPRYPTTKWLISALDVLPINVNVALHLCGAAVEDCVNGSDVHALGDRSADVLTTRILTYFMNKRSGRVQLNIPKAKVDELDFTEMLAAKKHENIQFIFQHNKSTVRLIESLSSYQNISVLCDNSGGRGVRESKWQPSPFPGLSYGYAGGIGPETIEQDLSDIEQATTSYETWVDMESSLRTVLPSGKDIFNLQRCRDVLTHAAKYVLPV